MTKILLVLLITTICLSFGAKGSKDCYGKNCPDATTGCKKEVKTSDDKKTLDTTISCLDSQGSIIDTFQASEENPYGPSTMFKSTSYSNTYKSSGSGGNVDININNVNPINENNIEDFAK